MLKGLRGSVYGAEERISCSRYCMDGKSKVKRKKHTHTRAGCKSTHAVLNLRCSNATDQTNGRYGKGFVRPMTVSDMV